MFLAYAECKVPPRPNAWALTRTQCVSFSCHLVTIKSDPADLVKTIIYLLSQCDRLSSLDAWAAHWQNGECVCVWERERERRLSAVQWHPTVVICFHFVQSFHGEPVFGAGVGESVDLITILMFLMVAIDPTIADNTSLFFITDPNITSISVSQSSRF